MVAAAQAPGQAPARSPGRKQAVLAGLAAVGSLLAPAQWAWLLLALLGLLAGMAALILQARYAARRTGQAWRAQLADGLAVCTAAAGVAVLAARAVTVRAAAVGLLFAAGFAGIFGFIMLVHAGFEASREPGPAAAAPRPRAALDDRGVATGPGRPRTGAGAADPSLPAPGALATRVTVIVSVLAVLVALWVAGTR